MQNRFIKYILYIICILNINNVFAGCKEEFPSLTCSTYNSTYESNKVCECVSCPTGYSIGSKSGTSANNYAIYSTCVSSSVSGSTVSGGTTCVAGTNCRSQNTTVNGVFYCWTGGSCSIGKLSGWMGSTNCLTSHTKVIPPLAAVLVLLGAVPATQKCRPTNKIVYVKKVIGEIQNLVLHVQNVRMA
ncbi:MAG: hypothetical protein MJ187_03755 [Alphaproteobacteria bacterium]|nr:hypothetical protein [Alphaproteobacteria bacterium]